MAIGIQSGYIVWVSKMYRGAVHDITIFREHLKGMLLAEGEKAVADLGYRGEPGTIKLPDDGTPEWQAQKAEARARHETCNKRFKQWNVMKNTFRHPIEFHQDCFTAVAVITQLQLENGYPLFSIEAFGNI